MLGHGVGYSELKKELNECAVTIVTNTRHTLPWKIADFYKRGSLLFVTRKCYKAIYLNSEVWASQPRQKQKTKLNTLTYIFNFRNHFKCALTDDNTTRTLKKKTCRNLSLLLELTRRIRGLTLIIRRLKQHKFGKEVVWTSFHQFPETTYPTWWTVHKLDL